jgi:hypothetical protein
MLDDLLNHRHRRFRRFEFYLFQIGHKELGQIFTDMPFHFIIRDTGDAARFILLQDPLLDLGDTGVALVHGAVALQAEVGVYPISDARLPGFVGDGGHDRPFEDF